MQIIEPLGNSFTAVLQRKQLFNFPTRYGCIALLNYWLRNRQVARVEHENIQGETR